jgi:mono/diheme cytochrome c family protein
MSPSGMTSTACDGKGDSGRLLSGSGGARREGLVLALAMMGLTITGPFATSNTVSAQGSRVQQSGGMYTEAQALRGKLLYATYCASCHSPDMSGGIEGPPLAGAAFRQKWNGSSMADVLKRIEMMPISFTTPGNLPPEQSVDVLAFIIFKNDFPAGSAELSPDMDVLSRIKFVADRP